MPYKQPTLRCSLPGNDCLNPVGILKSRGLRETLCFLKLKKAGVGSDLFFFLRLASKCWNFPHSEKVSHYEGWAKGAPPTWIKHSPRRTQPAAFLLVTLHILDSLQHPFVTGFYILNSSRSPCVPRPFIHVFNRFINHPLCVRLC